MTQRNPMNERYQTDEHQGKTRKSASQAKPVSKAASTTRDPAPKSKKEKRQEERERIRKEEEKAKTIGVSSEALASVQYRNYRRMYWIMLIGGGVCAIASFALSSMGDSYVDISTTLIMAAYILIFGAFFVDIFKVRKIRRGDNAGIPRGKSKEARRAQKEHAAKQREIKKEAEERYAAAKAKESEPAPSLVDRIKARFSSKSADTAEASVDDATKKPASATPKRVTDDAVEKPVGDTAKSAEGSTEEK